MASTVNQSTILMTLYHSSVPGSKKKKIIIEKILHYLTKPTSTMFSLKIFVNVMTKKTPNDSSIKTKNIKITEKKSIEKLLSQINKQQSIIVHLLIL